MSDLFSQVSPRLRQGARLVLGGAQTPGRETLSPPGRAVGGSSPHGAPSPTTARGAAGGGCAPRRAVAVVEAAA